MEFTYTEYDKLIKRLKSKGYNISSYHNYSDFKKSAILRHDIDYDLKRAIPFAEIENNNNVQSTYFILLTSDFYNPFSGSSIKIVNRIRELGHEIGLHFDEMRYEHKEEKWNSEEIAENILREAQLLEKVIGEPVKTVSMHRPSPECLKSNLEIPGIINSYGNEFFKNFKYVSDSRMKWREDINILIESGEYDRLHILTHAFWYSNYNKSIEKIVEEFIMDAKNERYKTLNDNITNLKDIVRDGLISNILLP